MKEQLFQYWRQLSERDRLMLSIGMIVCGFYLFYLLIYGPLSNAVAQRTQQLIEDKATLAWMEGVKHMAQPSKKAAEKINTTQMLAKITDSLKDANFKTFNYQIQQTGAHEVQLTYEKVPYTLWINWFSKLCQEYTFHIKQLHIHSVDPGVVGVELIIEV